MKAQETARELAVTALGLGRLPVAPGTWASAGAVAVYLLVRWRLPGTAGWVLTAAATLACVVAGIALGPWAEERFGRKDPHPFVIDEVAGQWLACALVPASGLLPQAAALAFFTFRLFDVAKPFPIRLVERLPGGWGMVLDDILAGAYAAVVSYTLLLLLFV